MKRLVTILAVLVVAAALPARAEAPGAAANIEQFAEADWIIMRGPQKADMYFALAWRTVNEKGPVTIGAVGKGKCRVHKTKHMHMISCHGSGRGKNLGVDGFELHPLLEDASMKVEMAGYTHTVDWTGRGKLPITAGGLQGGDDYVAVGAGMVREARADAKLFGRRMPKQGGWLSFSYLAQGAGAGAYTGAARSVEVAPDGTFTYTVELRRPR